MFSPPVGTIAKLLHDAGYRAWLWIPLGLGCVFLVLFFVLPRRHLLDQLRRHLVGLVDE